MTYNTKSVTKSRREAKLRWNDEDRPDRRKDQTREQHLKEKRLNNALRSRHIEEICDDEFF